MVVVYLIYISSSRVPKRIALFAETNVALFFLCLVRLNESLYGVKSFGEDYMAKKDLNRNSCLPNAMVDNVKESKLIHRSRLHLEEKKRRGLMFSGESVYVDPNVSGELRNKVVEAAREEGGLLVNEWLVGQQATHVVCEASSVGKYLGQSNNNLVTVSFTVSKLNDCC